jgi:hypothetical protein
MNTHFFASKDTLLNQIIFFCIPILTGGRVKMETPDGDSIINRNPRETASLIGSDKVEGTSVYGADKQKVGEIERVMIEKVGGKVAFSVLSFGGFLGIGEDYYPVPWSILTYDTGLGGYRTNLPATRSSSEVQ